MLAGGFVPLVVVRQMAHSHADQGGYLAIKYLLKLSDESAALVAVAGGLGEYYEKDIMHPRLLVGAGADRRTERRFGGAE